MPLFVSPTWFIVNISLFLILSVLGGWAGLAAGGGLASMAITYAAVTRKRVGPPVLFSEQHDLYITWVTVSTEGTPRLAIGYLVRKRPGWMSRSHSYSQDAGGETGFVLGPQVAARLTPEVEQAKDPSGWMDCEIEKRLRQWFLRDGLRDAKLSIMPFDDLLSKGST
ncbi:MAG: hypothetical protein H6807_01395 [Planctomycetes bacterium]|nr:hypothetical protein [Planctomycetota bacterium]